MDVQGYGQSHPLDHRADVKPRSTLIVHPFTSLSRSPESGFVRMKRRSGRLFHAAIMGSIIRHACPLHRFEQTILGHPAMRQEADVGSVRQFFATGIESEIEIA